MPTTSLFTNSCNIFKKVEAASGKTFNKSGSSMTTNKKSDNINEINIIRSELFLRNDEIEIFGERSML
jgi:hypothetical protein